jgi:hypothetical protein
MISSASLFRVWRSSSVRMILPPVTLRRVIDRELADFFRTHRTPMFNRAISRLCRFYNVRRPRVSWFEYLDWGKTAGKTYYDGRIHLVHPENWKRGRVYNTERMWVQMIYHEMAHYLFWTDAESKADLFMRRMVSGLRPAPRSRRPIPGTRRSSVHSHSVPRGRRQRARAAMRNRASKRRRARAA